MLTSNGLREKFADLITAIGVQQHRNEELTSDDLSKPNIDRMIQLVRQKTKKQMEASDNQVQQKLKGYSESETEFKKRIKQLEQSNSELSAMLQKD